LPLFFTNNKRSIKQKGKQGCYTFTQLISWLDIYRMGYSTNLVSNKEPGRNREKIGQTKKPPKGGFLFVTK
jgi:hypothetical protein